MVKMYDWSPVLKEKDVTLGGMDRGLTRRGLFNRWGYKTSDPVDPSTGHVKISDMPLRGYTGNYVGPRGKKTFEETSESGRQYGRRPFRGWVGGTVGGLLGAAGGSAVSGPGLGTLAGFIAGRKAGANWKDIVGRGRDNARMSRMWRAQQDALNRRNLRGEKYIPGRFAGKDKAEIADYIWKPGDPFKIYTDKGSQEIQRFMGVQGPVGGSLIQFLNRLIGYIPGLRDPTSIERHRERVERTRKGYKALEYYHKMKNGNPNWQMSDGDRRLVTNMMHDFYSTEHPDMDRKQIAMMANGVTKWNKEQFQDIHDGLIHYLEQTNSAGYVPPMTEHDERDAQVREASRGSDVRPEESASLEQAVREIVDRRKRERPETFEDGGGDSRYIEDIRDMHEMLGDWAPLQSQADSPSRFRETWEKNEDHDAVSLLAYALNKQKEYWHGKSNSVNVSNSERLGATPQERIEKFFLDEGAGVIRHLHTLHQRAENNNARKAVESAMEGLRQMVHGHVHGSAWDRSAGEEMHAHSRAGSQPLNAMMGFMLHDGTEDVGHAHAQETHGEYDADNPLSYFGSFQNEAPEEEEGLNFDG
tara:strand:- start:3630 stop:5387 length:1758 start_codon:yes stop_codon:yes gene_type:complete